MVLTLLLLPQFVWGELHIRKIAEIKIAEIDKTGQVSPDGEHLSYMDPDTGGLGLLNLRTLERRVLTDSHWPAFVQFSAFSADSRRESAVAGSRHTAGVLGNRMLASPFRAGELRHGRISAST